MSAISNAVSRGSTYTSAGSCGGSCSTLGGRWGGCHSSAPGRLLAAADSLKTIGTYMMDLLMKETPIMNIQLGTMVKAHRR